MSEEKEAIKYLEFLINEKCECEACQHAKKEYKTILNLLDKQKNEIEEKTTILLAGAKKVKQLEKEIEELKKPKYLAHFENNKITKMELINDYISKDKIRKKIKKAKEIKWHTPKLVIEYFEELLEEK